MPVGLIHTVARLAAPDPRTDAQLVAAFLSDANQGAFAELVRRHGPAVFGVCRRLLGPTPDAEDAFQATFLVLVRRARSTAWRASLGPWLYGVALRVARKARAVRAARSAKEKQVPAMDDPQVPPTEPDGTSAVVDEELTALPSIYRLPLVLCEIQGASRHDAARELGLSEGTLSSRLARGRKMLRARLAKRGVAPAAAGLAATVPAALASATVRNAGHALARTAGAVPAGVLFLTEEAVKTMIAKWKLATVMVAVCIGLTGFGAWQSSAQPAPATAVPPKKPIQIIPVDGTQIPKPKIVARVGKTNVITDQDVTASMFEQFHRELTALDGPARTTKQKELYTLILCDTIGRELVLDEMYAKLQKANKMSVLEEIQDFAAQSADRQMRVIGADTGAKSDAEFATLLRAHGLTAQVIHRQIERQTMAAQFASTMLKENAKADERKWIKELWLKGAVRVFNP